VSDKFEFFGADNKIYTSNSGSMYAMFIMIIINWALKSFINLMCLHFPSHKPVRRVANYFYNYNPRYVLHAVQRLLLESYFDIGLCTLINLLAFFDEREDWSNLSKFFSNPENCLNSIVVMISFIYLFIFLIWAAFRIH
jgi:hypothetical protein